MLARQAGADVYVVDMGVAADLVPGPRPVRPQGPPGYVGPGDRPGDDPRRGRAGRCWPAPRSPQRLVDDGYDCLLTGDMGIANTTPSAALVAALTGSAPDRVTGRGTGVDDPTLARKVEVVTAALRDATGDRRPGRDAGLGRRLRARRDRRLRARRRGAAGAGDPRRRDRRVRRAGRRRRWRPEAVGYCFAGHRSVEPGHAVALDQLGLRPLVDLDLRLGEGTGAVLAFPIVEAAGALLREMATFDSAGVARKDAAA